MTALAAVGFGAISPVLASAAESDWYGVDPSGEATVVLYFVYSSTCPHCNEAEPFVDDLAQRHSWLRVERLRVDGGGQGVDRAVEVADSIGPRLSPVPTFMFCESVMVGYGSADTTGAVLERQITSCKADLAAGADADVEEVIEVPVLGDIDPASGSHPLWTVTLAGLDAFNPCAFFVLLILLSLLVHAGSRGRMMAVGGTFVAKGRILKLV